MERFRFFSPRVFLTALVCAALSTSSLNAQSAALVEKAKEVQNLLQSGQLVVARPLMREILPTAESGDFGPGIAAKLQFFIGLSYIVEYFDQAAGADALAQAKTELEAFIAKYPNDENVPVAQYNLGDIAATNGQFEEALKFYIPLYQSPRRNVDPYDVLKKIVMLYAASEQWVPGIPFFTASMQNSPDATDRTTAAAYLIIGQAQNDSLADLEQALEFLQTPSPVFFSTRFNLALMNVADKLKESGNLPMANLFYQFVRDYETLQDGLRRYITAFRETVTRFEGNSFRRNDFMVAKAQLDNAEADMQALSTMESYTPVLKWKISQTLMEMGRDWEAYWLFYRMADVYPNHKNAEDILYLAYSLAHKLGNHGDMEKLAMRYLRNTAFLQYRATIASQLGDFYASSEAYEKLYQLTEDYLPLAPPNDEGSQIVLFTHGMMRLGRYQIDELIADFTRYDRDYGHTSSGTVIHYFLGLGYLLSQEFDLSIRNLDEVIKVSGTKFQPDAMFRKALATMGKDDIEGARKQLEAFISRFPSNPLRASAELTLGGVVDMLGDSNQALVHYYRVAEHTQDPGLLGSAEVKISRVLVFQRKAEEAIRRLQSFVERFGDSPESIAAAEELVDLLNREERPRESLAVLRLQVENFIENVKISEIDPMLISYIRQDRQLRAMREATDAFFREASTDAQLLEELIKDRTRQFRYFRENDKIDVAVKDAFTYDNDFRKRVIDTLESYRPPPPPQPPIKAGQPLPPPPPPQPIDLTGKTVPALAELKATIDTANRVIPDESVEIGLKARAEQAREVGNLPLVLRIETAFALAEEPPRRPLIAQSGLIEDRDLWEQLPLASRIWILRDIANYDANRAIEELVAMRSQIVSTNSELPMYQILAKSYETVGAKELALESHSEIVKRFASRRAAADSILEAGRLLIEMRRLSEAREKLQGILYRPDWMGELHAKALLMLGRSYNAENLHAEAHGFFERVMLGFPGHHEQMAEAYLEDLRTLQLMNEPASMKTVYKAFLATPGLRDTAAGKKLLEEFNL